MKKILWMMLLLSNVCYADDWECVDKKADSYFQPTCQMTRYRMPKGWVLMRCAAQCQMVYVPDPEHEWSV